MISNYKNSSGSFGRKLFFSFLPGYFIYEASAGFLFPKQNLMAYLIGTFFVLYTLSQIIKYKIKSEWLKPYYLFWGYLFVLIFFSSRFDYSLKVYSQALLGAMFLPLAFYYIKTTEDLFKLTKSIILLMVLYLLNIGISNVFNLGGNSYDKVFNETPFQMGNIFTTGLNSMTYSMILLPWIYRMDLKRGKKFLISVLAVITIITLILAAKRISVSGVLVGYLVLLLFQKNRTKILRIIITAAILLAVTFPLYSGQLYKQINIRSERLILDNYDQEGRYMETLIVLDEIFSFDNIRNSLLGKEMFNSPNNYGIGIYNRQLHSDYNVVLHGSGIFGLCLMATIYLILFGQFFSLRRKIKFAGGRNDYMVYLDAIFISFMIVTLWISFSGGINGVVYNALRNSVLGGILGYYSTITGDTASVNKPEIHRRTNWKLILSQPYYYRDFLAGRR